MVFGNAGQNATPGERYKTPADYKYLNIYVIFFIINNSRL